MHLTTDPEWQHLLLMAVGVALLTVIIINIPHIGRVIRALLSFALLVLCVFLVLQQAPYNPLLAPVSQRLGLDGQRVEGRAVHVRSSPGGHFWARVTINGVERRMLVDSGSTITALSRHTADLAGVESGTGLFPVVMHTANGAASAETGTVKRMELGGIEARNLKVIVTPALGTVDVLGMNFLSQLDSWRVENGTLILVPKGSASTAAQAGGGPSS